MKIIITGGNGNIGRITAEQLSGKAEVITLSNTESSLRFKHFQTDITDRGALSAIMKNEAPDCVIHLASLLNSASRKNPAAAVKINVMGTVNLLEIAAEQRFRLIFGSSFNAIGNPRGYDTEKAFAEDDDTKPMEFYGMTKNYIERLGLAMREVNGVQFIAARIPTIVGIGQKSRNSPWREDMYTKTVTGGEIEFGFADSTSVPLCDVREAARALGILALAEEVREPLYNLPNESLKLKGVAEYLSSLNGSITFRYRSGSMTGAPNIVSADRFLCEFRGAYEYHRLFDYIKEYRNENL